MASRSRALPVPGVQPLTLIPNIRGLRPLPAASRECGLRGHGVRLLESRDEAFPGRWGEVEHGAFEV